MVFRSYRNKSDIDPSQALIDPQIDGVGLSIHQLPSEESCYWGQVVWGCELKLLDSRGLLIIGCHSQIDTPADAHTETEEVTKISGIISNH